MTWKGSVVDHVEERILDICMARQTGLTIARAARAVGVPGRHIKRVLRLAEEGDERCTEIADLLATAEVIGERMSLEVIMASRDWRAHAWHLERTRAEQYSDELRKAWEAKNAELLDEVQELRHRVRVATDEDTEGAAQCDGAEGTRIRTNSR